MKRVMEFLSGNLFTLLILTACLCGILTIAGILAQEPEEEHYTCQLERVLPSIQSSDGIACGTLYTLDGKPMTQQYAVGRVKNPDTNIEEPVLLTNVSRSSLRNMYIPTEACYASAVGLDSDLSNGFLNRLERILKSNDSYSNRREAKGNSVITTLVSEGQRAAYEELQCFRDVAGFSSISVIGGDGSLLVNVGSNCDAIMEYDQRLMDYYQSEYSNSDNLPKPRAKDKVYNDFGNGTRTIWKGKQIRCEDAECVGSVFKIITARVLEQNDSALSEEFSVYNNSFMDTDRVDFGEDELPIRNHDYNWASYPREVGLSEALMYSSNTYFLRHAQALGLDRYMQQLSELFQLDYNINTDSHCIPQMPFDNPEEVTRFREKVTYGQEAILTTVRLASVVSHAVSGEAHDLFSVAEVRTPSQEVIFHHIPQPEIAELHMDVHMQTDPLVRGLQKTFEYYMNAYPSEYTDFSKSFLYSGRILAKSGTATQGATTENHTMVVCITDAQRSQILCTAVIAVNDMDISHNKEIKVNEGAMSARLLRVIAALGLEEDF